MRILELTRSFYPSIGGMEKFVSDRLKIYESLGYEYNVITTTHSEKQLKNSLKVDSVKYLPSYTPYEIVPSLKTAMNFDYDILSVNQVTYQYANSAIDFAFKNRKKIILTPHFYFHTDRFKIFKDIHFKYVLPKMLAKIDKMICFTEYEATFWVNNFPSIESKIEIIPHYFKPSKIKGKNITDEFGEFLLFVGRGEKNKRLDLLLTAFNSINTKYNLVLTVEKSEISSELLSIVNNNRRIHLLGRVSEERKQNLLASCSALILPTMYEAFGIVNYEASYYKKPLIISNLDIFEDILNTSGAIIFDNNVKSIKEKTLEFLRLDLTRKVKMGMLNYENLEKYTFEKIKKKYKTLFSSLISTSKHNL